jgi:hypothetical protein
MKMLVRCSTLRVICVFLVEVDTSCHPQLQFCDVQSFVSDFVPVRAAGRGSPSGAPEGPERVSAL